MMGLVQSAQALELSTLEVGLAALLLVANAGLSLAWSLGLERQLAWAALRSTVQLLLLGLVLRWIFDARSPLAVSVALVWMVLAAAWTAKGRMAHAFPRMRGLLLASIAASSMLVTAYAMAFVITDGAWYEPRRILPIVGMLLGNTLTGITLSLDRLLGGFLQERARLEALLAHGATPKEALRDVRQDAARTGLVPILNSMLIVGLVSLPGMMTGQILAGVSAMTAVRAQLMILFLIAGATAAGVALNVWWAPRMLFDSMERPRFESIRELSKRGR